MDRHPKRNQPTDKQTKEPSNEEHDQRDQEFRPRKPKPTDDPRQTKPYQDRKSKPV